MAPTIFAIGGCVRDEIMRAMDPTLPRPNDWDFVAVFPELVGQPGHVAYRELELWLIDNGFRVWLSKPEFLTSRAQFPKGHQHEGLTADFVVARRDGAYGDGRRPDEVFVGDLADDMARRDFTINAIAQDEDGFLVDAYDGVGDINARVIRCVGNVMDRMGEDALRALRAVRFAVTKGFTLDAELGGFLSSAMCRNNLANVSTERRREELRKAFDHDTLATLDVMHRIHPRFAAAALEGLKLAPSMRERLP